MKFKIEDRQYEFNGEYTVEEAMLYFDKAQVGVAELQANLNRGNPYVVATMMFILKKRAGEAVRWQDMLAFPVMALQFVPEETPAGDESGDDSKGEAPDPTEGTGTTPEPGTATTS